MGKDVSGHVRKKGRREVIKRRRKSEGGKIKDGRGEKKEEKR